MTPTILTWMHQGSQDGFSFEVQIAADMLFNTLVSSGTVTTTTFTSPILEEGTYYWRVRAYDRAGYPSGWSVPWMFTIDVKPPPAPVLIFPDTGVRTTLRRQLLDWESVGEALYYEVQIDMTNPPERAPIVTESNSYRQPTTRLNTTYYWRVRAVDRAGNASLWSEVRSLTLISFPSDVPVLNLVMDETPTLTWTRVTWARAYHVQVSRHPNFLSAVVVNRRVTSTTLTPELSDGTYYWRVRALHGNYNGQSVWGPWSRTETLRVYAP
jgi:hypothetical protein